MLFATQSNHVIIISHLERGAMGNVIILITPETHSLQISQRVSPGSVAS